MNTAQVHPAIRCALGTLEAFMRLGFPRSALPAYPGLTREGKVLWKLTWRGATFVVGCGTYELDSKVHLAGEALLTHFRESWRELAQAVGEGKVARAVLDDCYEGCGAKKEPERFLRAIAAAGIVPPGGVNLENGVAATVLH